MSKTQAEDKIMAALIFLMRKFPFFSYLLTHVECVPVEWIPSKTMATDGRKLFWDRKFVNKCSVQQVAWGLAHEVLHLALNHIGRKDGYDFRRFACAADFVVNWILAQQVTEGHLRLDPPPGILYDDRFADMAVEEVYEILPAKISSSTFDSHLDDPDLDCPESHKMDDEMDSKWRSYVQAADAHARENGRKVRGLDKVIRLLVEPEICWRSALNDFVCQFSRDDYSWAHPNRKYLHRGLILPGLFSESIGDVAVCVDTSASISEEQLEHFVAEMSSISALRPAKMHVVLCDDEVKGHFVLSKDEGLDSDDITIKGGGNTDFRPAFDFVESGELTPRCVIYLTDGDGVYPRVEPDYPVLWVMTRGAAKPPWGQHVHLSV